MGGTNPREGRVVGWGCVVRKEDGMPGGEEMGVTGGLGGLREMEGEEIVWGGVVTDVGGIVRGGGVERMDGECLEVMVKGVRKEGKIRDR